MKTSPRTPLCLLAAIVAITTPAIFAQQQVPPKEDAWFDPKDWFDENNIESDNDHDDEIIELDPKQKAARQRVHEGRSPKPLPPSDPLTNASEQNVVQRYAPPSLSRTPLLPPARITGAIRAITTEDTEEPDGARAPHLIARIEDPYGDEVLVDLGRADQLKQLRLGIGERLAATGREGQVRGDPAFIAHEIVFNGRRVRTGVDSGAEKPAANPETQLARETITIRGKVTEILHSRPVGANSSHTLVKVLHDDGHGTLIDLGASASPKRIGLDHGDWVTVSGHFSQRPGQRILVANRLRIDGSKQLIKE